MASTYLDTLLKTQGRSIEVINRAENSMEDMLADFTAIIYSFCARLDGQRRAKRKTEAIGHKLEARIRGQGREGGPRCNWLSTTS